MNIPAKNGDAENAIVREFDGEELRDFDNGATTYIAQSFISLGG